MRNRAIIGCLIVLILIPMSLGLTNPSGEEKAMVKSTTFNDMEWDVTFGGIHSEEGDTLVQTTDG
ncbi:MAG: hypothetical protein ACW98F_08465, partial [Candidatus Hodarchaeales archaeon]